MMSKFIVELHLDGYTSIEEMDKACEEFIYDQLDFSASSVKVTKLNETNKVIPYDQGSPEGGNPVLALRMTEYEIVNLAAALETVSAPNGTNNPLQAIHTGDWTLALCHRLKEEIKRLNIKHLPNQTSQEMINRAKNFK